MYIVQHIHTNSHTHVHTHKHTHSHMYKHPHTHKQTHTPTQMLKIRNKTNLVRLLLILLRNEKMTNNVNFFKLRKKCI